MMAFSMFCRSTANIHQVLKIGTKTAFSTQKACIALPITRLLSEIPKEKSAPTLNAVRQFSTSVIRSSSHGDHSKVWVAERLVSVALVPLIPLSLMMPCKLLDSLVAVTVVAHIFWGFEAIAVDYVRAILFGPFIPKVAIGLVYAMCIATLGGLFYLIQHDIGIANTIRKLWSIKGAA